MAKPTAHQLIVAERRYRCTGCGDCCKRWHVFLPPGEQERLQALPWSAEDQARFPAQRTTMIGGHEYIAHRADQSCIYLEGDTGLCLIHKRFGYETKPLGCQVYPYTVVTTFPDQFSVMPRFDCPAVRADVGPALRQDIGTMRTIVDRMGLRGGFDRDTLGGLTPATATRLMEELYRRVINQRDIPYLARLPLAIMAVERLELMGPVFLNETDLAPILPSFFDRVRSDAAHQRCNRLTSPEQWRFLCLLAGYLRRDEDIVKQGAVARLRRTAGFVRLFFGRPNFHVLGNDHPNLAIPRHLLFRQPIANATTLDLSLYFDLLKLRLQTYQFFGPANYRLDFFTGLKSLLLTGPLVLAVAKSQALARDPQTCQITAADVDYAVGAIDHSFGRSAYLSFGLFTVLTRQMTEAPAYLRLLHALAG